MSESENRRSKKAGLSGLFCCAALAAAALLMVPATVALAEPLTIDVMDAAPIIDQWSRQPAISIKMGPGSAKRFADITTQNVGRKLELRIDGKTVMAPVIREPILGGSVQVSGGWTSREANDLADSIAAGKSKVEVEVVNE